MTHAARQRDAPEPDRLEAEHRAYEEKRAELESTLRGKWVVFHGNQHVNTLDSFEAAAEWALEEFGDDSFLIRQVGERISIPPIFALPIVTYAERR